MTKVYHEALLFRALGTASHLAVLGSICSGVRVPAAKLCFAAGSKKLRRTFLLPVRLDPYRISTPCGSFASGNRKWSSQGLRVPDHGEQNIVTRSYASRSLFCCRSGTRTPINGSRGRCPTIRRTGNTRTIPLYDTIAVRLLGGPSLLTSEPSDD